MCDVGKGKAKKNTESKKNEKIGQKNGETKRKSVRPLRRAVCGRRRRRETETTEK